MTERTIKALSRAILMVLSASVGLVLTWLGWRWVIEWLGAGPEGAGWVAVTATLVSGTAVFVLTAIALERGP